LPPNSPFDLSTGNPISRGFDKVASKLRIDNASDKLNVSVAESSGQRMEQAAKSIYALGKMRSILIKDGVITSKDANDILKNWDEWARTPANKEKFLLAQDKIQEQLSYM